MVAAANSTAAEPVRTGLGLPLMPVRALPPAARRCIARRSPAPSTAPAPVEVLCDCEVRHGSLRRRPMPSSAPPESSDDVSCANLLDGITPSLDAPGTRRDNQDLTSGMRVPRGTGAGLERDGAGGGVRGGERFEQHLDLHAAREVLRGRRPDGPRAAARDDQRCASADTTASRASAVTVAATRIMATSLNSSAEPRRQTSGARRRQAGALDLDRQHHRIQFGPFGRRQLHGHRPAASPRP